MKQTQRKFLLSGETTDLKYCITGKMRETGREKYFFQMLSFEAKLEHRRLKYRSTKIAYFGILESDAMGCLLKSIFSWFSKAKGKHRN